MSQKKAHFSFCMTSRNWCFTLNNPGIGESPKLWTTKWNNIKLITAQLELGKNGTLHYQGYLEVNQPCRIAALKSNLSERAHWEKRMGSRLQALQYVTKEDTCQGDRLFYNNGSWAESSEELENYLKNLKEREEKTTSQKQRLESIRLALSENSSTIEEVADKEFDLWVRYYRAFEHYLVLKTTPRSHPVDVHVLQGPTGTGKSKWALDTYPGAYWKQRSQWWDGYLKHETVILDEFYGWLPFDLLLRVCDRYPLLVETKGGQVQFVAKTIIITTNQLPSSWYKSSYFPAFVRRVTKWHILPIWGVHTEYGEYTEFMKHASGNLILS